MLSFDKVPIMDKEYFDIYVERATSFGVWIQLSPYLQTCLDITKEQALELARVGFMYGGSKIWGQFCHGGRLELSNTSQWLTKIGFINDK